MRHYIGVTDAYDLHIGDVCQIDSARVPVQDDKLPIPWKVYRVVSIHENADGIQVYGLRGITKSGGYCECPVEWKCMQRVW